VLADVAKQGSEHEVGHLATFACVRIAR
jgi:hypothetical protein